MTRLLIIRHGQSESNITGVFTGQLDIPLSKLGREQAEVTASYIVNHYHIDKAYSSDLSRAYDTAKAVADKVGIKVHKTKELREIFAGDWQGVSFDKLLEFESYRVWKTDIGSAVCKNGESVANLYDRVIKEFTKIARENDGKTVVIATHASPVRAFQCYLQYNTISKMKDLKWGTNASFSEVTYENGKFSIVKLGYDEHLGNMISTLAKNC